MHKNFLRFINCCYVVDVPPASAAFLLTAMIVTLLLIKRFQGIDLVFLVVLVGWSIAEILLVKAYLRFVVLVKGLVFLLL